MRFVPLVLICTPLLAHASGVAVTVRDASGKPVSDAVLYADPENGQFPKPMKTGEIEQKGLRFIPLVTVIQTGSKINFPNNDKVRHHIYSFSPAHKFDQKLYSGVAAPPQTFDKAGVVVLGCNIHDKMIAYVKVVDTPWFAKSDASGVARIELPAGKYTLRAWHYNMTGGPTIDQALDVKAGDAPVSASVAMTLKPVSADPDADSRY